MINNRVNPEYYEHLRLPLLTLAHGEQQHRVLEIGCGSGQSLVYFKENGADFVAGVELVPEVADMARGRPEIDAVYTGSIEEIEIDIAPGSLDLVVAGHVLEHVADPWAVLRKMRRLMKPGGQLIGSLPNVRNVTVVLPLLLQGKWEYQDEGIMDWTHLRFFSRSTIEKLLTETGFTVERIVPEVGGARSIAADKITFGLLRHFFAFTYNFSARNSHL